MAGPHDYFDALRSRADHWKSLSLRDPAQLTYPDLGGYANSSSRTIGLWVTYDPDHDTDPAKQDAAKVRIPPFQRHTDLSAPATATDDVLHLVNAGAGEIGNYTQGRTFRVDQEIMVVVSRAGNDITATRGTNGTTAAPHAAGAAVELSNNSLPNQIRFPLGTIDGRYYLLTWDCLWSPSYIRSGLTSHKAFQVATLGGSRWIETRARYAGGSSCCEVPGSFDPATDVGIVDVRGYNNLGGPAEWTPATSHLMGPGPTRIDPIYPKNADPPSTVTFVIKPIRWLRFWVAWHQRANDYDYYDMWVADEVREAVQMYRQVPGSVVLKNGVSSVESFWFEENTSTYNHVRGHQGDFVNYVRNFVALQSATPIDIASLLVRPGASVPVPPPARPRPPTNVRPVQ